MSLVSYDIFECKSEEDIQAFKKYYAEDEEYVPLMVVVLAIVMCFGK